MNRHDSAVMIAAIALILLAAWVRFDGIDSQSLWNDEGTSYGQSLRTAPEIALHAGADIHPPGYYWLLAGWRLLTGESEFALRSLSAIFSILSAIAAYALGKRLYGDMAGLVAMAAVAVNTFSITYAQEARMYALLAFYAAASTWTLVNVIKTPSNRAALLLAISTAAGMYTNYAYAGVLALHAVFGLMWLVWALRTGEPVRAVVRVAALGYGAALLLYLPWLPTALHQVTSWGSTGTPISLGEALPIALSWLVTGPTAPHTGISVAALLLMAIGLYQLDGETRRIPRALALILPPLWVVLTLGGFLALDLFREANLKFLIPAQIAVALWMGRGAWVLWHIPLRRGSPNLKYLLRATAVLMAVAVISNGLTGVGALRSDPALQRDDYRGIAQTIAADGQPDAAVILNAPGQIEVFGYYARQYGPEWSLIPLPIGMTVDEAATRAAMDEILASHRRIYGVLWGTDERDPNRVVESVLNTLTYPIDEHWYGDVRLARYVTPGAVGETQASGAAFTFDGGAITLVSYALSSETISAGDVLEIALAWEADVMPAANYKVTVQLLTPEGVLVTQRDAEPVGYQRPTRTWQAGETIHDRHALVMPNDLPLPQYQLIVGLYNPENSGERLPVNGQDALLLTTLTVKDGLR